MSELLDFIRSGVEPELRSYDVAAPGCPPALRSLLDDLYRAIPGERFLHAGLTNEQGVASYDTPDGRLLGVWRTLEGTLGAEVYGKGGAR